MSRDSVKRLEVLQVPLDHEGFLCDVLRELSGTLQDVVGVTDATGFVSVVGQNIGGRLGASYREALQLEALSREQVADVLVDLKRRIHGDFFVIEQDDDKIVLGNRACPFGDSVVGRPSLCMMTSNVFGRIAADNLGYARVVLDETIADGADGCRVTIFLERANNAASEAGREYFAD